MSRLQKYVYTAFFLFFLLSVVFLICKPSEALIGASEGLFLWSSTVLPSTFPFLFLTSLFSNLGYAERLSNKLSPFSKKLLGGSGKTGYILFLTMLSGYPVGAKAVSELKESGYFSLSEAEKATAICSSPSPVFLTATVGAKMFSSQSKGFILLISAYLSLFLTALIFKNKKCISGQKNKRPLSQSENDGALYSSMYSSVKTALMTGGFITVFYLLSFILGEYLFSPLASFLSLPVLKPVLSSLVECTSGIAELSKVESILTLPLSSFFLCEGGLSIIIQQAAFLKKADIPLKTFFISRQVQSVLAFIITLLFSILLRV